MELLTLISIQQNFKPLYNICALGHHLFQLCYKITNVQINHIFNFRQSPEKKRTFQWGDNYLLKIENKTAQFF